MFPWIRDRFIADPAYLFKIFTEVTIDSGLSPIRPPLKAEMM